MENRIQQILNKKGKSQHWLAQRITLIRKNQGKSKMDCGYLNRLITQKIQTPRLDMAFDIARALGRSIHEVFIDNNGNFDD